MAVGALAFNVCVYVKVVTKFEAVNIGRRRETLMGYVNGIDKMAEVATKVTVSDRYLHDAPRAENRPALSRNSITESQHNNIKKNRKCQTSNENGK